MRHMFYVFLAITLHTSVSSAQELKELTKLKSKGGHRDCVAFSPDSKRLATRSGMNDEDVELWDVATEKKTATLKGHTWTISSLAFSPDGKILASAGAGPDETVRLWDVPTGKDIAVLKGHSNAVLGVTFSPDGKTLASCSSDTTIRLWSVADRKQIQTLKDKINYVQGVAYNSDGKTIASATEFKAAVVWDVASGKRTSVVVEHAWPVLAVAFSPDGKTIASGGGGREAGTGKKGGDLMLYNVATDKETVLLKSHPDAITSVAFSPDGKTLASAGEELLIWDVTTGKKLSAPQDEGKNGRVNAVAYSPNGKLLAVKHADGILKLYQIASSK